MLMVWLGSPAPLCVFVRCEARVCVCAVCGRAGKSPRARGLLPPVRGCLRAALGLSIVFCQLFF